MVILSLVSYLGGEPAKNSWVMWLTLIGLVLITSYELFVDLKKSVALIDKKLVISKRNKVIQEIDLSINPRIAVGTKSIRIILPDKQEFYLHFSEFNHKSIKILKGLRVSSIY